MRKFAISFNMLLPIILAALLFIPYTLNFLAHAMVGEKQFPPIIMMKLPVESTAVTLPAAVVQSTPFDITLQLDSDALAKRINDIVAKFPHGVAMQGISGKVLSNMQAEIAGNGFHIDNPGPQAQLISTQGGTLWSWKITPLSPNRQTLALRLYIIAIDRGQESQQIVDLAEIQTFVQKNPAEWMKRYGIWFLAAGLLVGVIWRRIRRSKN
ncbi:hypothetical protein [Nitrosomonas communis]|uniref:Uncharacterized protein n=1 Tax=Nitrosomonas communis TaxID=44574 RepID=A0A1I4K1V1_9PROT|nr:hypothetical protein [Nitrosomonas communis]SFL72755.1 hypothetical protein SAMN05421863_100375 [Nitrosomonas communis]